MNFLRALSEFISGKYGCGSIFVAIGTTISVVLWFSGATAATSYILPIGITVIGELIKFSAFRQIKNQLLNKADYLHFLNDRNVFLTEKNRHYETEVKMLYKQINHLKSVIEADERESNIFKEEFDSILESPPESKPKRVLH